MLSFDLQINSELTIKFQSELVLFPSATGREGEELWPLLYRETLATAVMLSVKSSNIDLIRWRNWPFLPGSDSYFHSFSQKKHGLNPVLASELSNKE